MFIILPMAMRAMSSCSSWLRFAGSVTTDGISPNRPVMFHLPRQHSLLPLSQARFHEQFSPVYAPSNRKALEWTAGVLVCGCLFRVHTSLVFAPPLSLSLGWLAH